MIKKTKAIEIEDSFGIFKEFKKRFALDKIELSNLVFLYKVLIVERYSSKKFNVINYNPLMNVNKLHTKLHNVLSESYINSYKTRNNIKDDNEHVRDRIKDKLREFASLPYHNSFVRFTKYVIDRLKQRCDEIKNIKDEVVKKKAIEKLDNTLFHFSHGREGISQVINEGERKNNEAQKIYNKYKGTLTENFYKNSLLDCVVNSQYCDGLVQLVLDIKKELHGVNTDNNIHMLSNGIRQQALKIIKEIYHIEDKEAEERYHNGLLKLWGGKFRKGMVNFLQKQIQTNLKKEKPEDKTEQQVNKEEEKSENKTEQPVNNNKNNIYKSIFVNRNKNNNTKSSYGMNLQKREETNKMIQKATDCKDFDLNKIYDNSLNKSKQVAKNNNDSKLARKRLYENEDTNKFRKELIMAKNEIRKELFNTDKNGKIIIKTKKISQKREKEMVDRLSKPKKKPIQVNTKNSGKKLTKDEQQELINHLYYKPMGKYDKSVKPLTNLHNNNKTFITELK